MRILTLSLIVNLLPLIHYRPAEPEPGCRPCRPSSDATTTAEERCTDYHNAIVISCVILGVDNRDWDVVCICVCVRG